MSEFHELTNVLWDKGMTSKTVELDRIIRAWLEEKARKINGNCSYTCMSDLVDKRTLLGLSPAEKKEEGVKTWPCEHITSDTSFVSGYKVLVNVKTNESVSAERWRFCPVCGAKRPEEKTMVEELAEVLRVTQDKEVEDKGSCEWVALAAAALKFVREEK